MREGLRDGVECDTVDGVMQVDGEAEEVFREVFRVYHPLVFVGVLGGATKEVRGGGVGDCLDGEEDVAAADGVALAQVFGGLLGCFFESALGGKVVICV